MVGYPPCPHLEHFLKFVPEKFGIPVVVGTHPIPEKHFTTHGRCGTWAGPEWRSLLEPTRADPPTRLAYD